jgi:hypothetical protein
MLCLASSVLYTACHSINLVFAFEAAAVIMRRERSRLANMAAHNAPLQSTCNQWGSLVRACH